MFKVGQRVKLVKGCDKNGWTQGNPKCDPNDPCLTQNWIAGEVPVGTEGTIIEFVPIETRPNQKMLAVAFDGITPKENYQFGITQSSNYLEIIAE